MNEYCVHCHSVIPEERQVCFACERGRIKLGMILQTLNATKEDVGSAYNFMEGEDDVRIFERTKDKVSTEE